MSMSPFIHGVRFIAILSLITVLAAAIAAADNAADLDAELAAALNARLEKLTVPESKFDDVPAQREAYVRKYRDGFAGTMKDERLPFHFGDDPILRAESDGARAGRVAGTAALAEDFAAAVKQLRSDPKRRITKASEAVRLAMGFNKKLDDLQLLLERGADPNGVAGSWGIRHMAVAIHHGDTAALTLFLKHGGNANLADEGDSPLHLQSRHAGARDAASRFKLLLQHKANVNAKDKNGVTPLHMVVTGEAALLLIKAGAKVDAVDADGNTPLHRSRIAGVIDALLKNGAPLAAVNKEGERAGSTPYVQLFQKHVKEHGSLPADTWLHVMVEMNVR